jgi:hypothetical protein
MLQSMDDWTTPRAARSAHLPRLGMVSIALALLAGPVAAEASNAVVIDFDQGRLILGWIGLWLVAALTFGACADKRIRLMTRLAHYLTRRAQLRASERSDKQLREWARDDPRIMADLMAAVDHGHDPHAQGWDVTPRPAPAALEPTVTATSTRETAAKGRRKPSRGFQSTPLPGLPRHLQYLPT